MRKFNSAIFLVKNSVAKSVGDGCTALLRRIVMIEKTSELPRFNALDQSQLEHEALTGPGEVVKVFDVDHGNAS